MKAQASLSHSSWVSSLPDVSEFPSYSLTQWKNWFIEVASLIISKTPDDGVTIFYQSDIKHEGLWVDKAYLCQKASENLGHELLWHKVACRITPGLVSFGRPAYSHILCFSKSRTLDPGKSTPDVLSDLGEKTWPRGMGLNASLMIAKFIKEEIGSDLVVNPFCGEGSMLAAANAYDLAAIGIERSPKRAQKAQELALSSDLKSWHFI